MELWMGTAKVDITPEQAVPLAGFAVRDNQPMDGVRTPIFLRIAYFRQTDAEGRERRAVVVAADLIWWGSDRLPLIAERLKDEWGIAPGCFVLNASHSHSGPQTSFRFHRLLGEADPAYVEELERRLFAGIAQAAAAVEPVTVERGTGRSRVGVQRRRYAHGEVFGGQFPDGIMDPELGVVRFSTVGGGVKAIFVHYAAHPTTTKENRLSGEFPGVAAERLEREIGDGAVCLFLQGCCGDISVYSDIAGPEAQTEWEKTVFMGEKLAADVAAVLRAPMRTLSAAPLSGEFRAFPLALQPLPGREELLSLVEKGVAPYSEWAEEMLRRFDERKAELTMEVSRLELADGLALLAMNAEVVVEYGLFVKRLTGGDVLPVPYSNGMIGYVPTEMQIYYGGYEANSSSYYFHMPSRLVPATERTVRDMLAAACGYTPG